MPTTTGGGVVAPDVSYDPTTNTYLAVTGKQKVQGAWVNPDGTLNGSAFNLATATAYQQGPSVLCGTGGVCLTVWHEGDSGTTPIARLVSLNGGLLTLPFALGPRGSNWTMPSGIAYSPAADLFIVTWMGDYLGTTEKDNIWIALVNSSGTVTYSGRLTTGTAYERQPAAGYNPSTNQFYVIYGGVVASNAYAYANVQRVDMTGASIGGPIQVDQSGADYIARIDYDIPTQSMLASFNRGGTRIYGRQVNGDGTVGSLLTLSSNYGAYDALGSAYNPISKSFLLVTHGPSVDDVAIEISSGFANLGAFKLTDNPNSTGNFQPRVSSSTVDPNWLAVTSMSFSVLVAQFASSTADAGNDVGPPPPPPCTVQTTAGSTTANPLGDSGSITVTIPSPPCDWTAVSNGSWLHVSPVTSGTTSDTVSWTADENTTGLARNAKITINSNVITITQGQANNPLQFDATTLGGDFFGYNKTSGVWLSKAYNGTPFKNLSSGSWAAGWQILPARFNSDALTDLFFYNPSTGAWRKAVNTGAGMFNLYFPPNLETGWTPLVLDLNGDGLSDVLLYNQTTGAWKRGISSSGLTNFTYATGSWAPGWQIFKANFNGDGRDDIFLYNQSTGAWAKAITQSDLSFTIVPGDTTWEVGWQITPGDFDGDGITDLLAYRVSDGHAMRVTFTDSSATYTNNTWDPGWTVRAGDINADGKTDLMLYNPANGAWDVETSNGGWFDDYAGPSAVGTGWDLRLTYLDTDGAQDALWYMPTTGQTRVWLMQDAATHTEIAGPTITTNLALVTDLPTALTNAGVMPYPIPVCGTAASPTASTASGFGGTGNLNVSVGLPSCGWTAVSNAAWLGVSPPSGTGAGSVTWTANPNTTGAVRTATITIGGTVTTITQKAQSNPLQLDGASGGDFLTYKSSTGAWASKLQDGSPFTTGGSGTWAAGWQISAAKFNTDGLSDLFFYNPSSGAYRKAINAGGGTFNIYFPPTMLAAGYTVTVGDFNGDGITDVFLYNPTTGAWKRGMGTVGMSNFTFTTGAWAAGWQVFRANFNNDGRDDLFLYNPTGGQWQRAMTQADGSFSYVNGDTTWEAGWGVYPGDFDGDGITDLFLYRASDGHAQRVTFTSNSATYQSNTWGTGLTIRTGDLNADGKTDVFAYNTADGTWSTAVANGSGWFDVYNSLLVQNAGTGWVPFVDYYDTDIMADVLWYRPSTGETMVWITVSPSVFTTTTGPTLPTGLSLVADPPF